MLALSKSIPANRAYEVFLLVIRVQGLLLNINTSLFLKHLGKKSIRENAETSPQKIIQSGLLLCNLFAVSL